LRICIISQYFPPDIGGASTRVSNAIKGLRSKGHEIFVVTAFPHYPHGHIPKEYRGRAFAVEGDEKVRVFRVWVPPLPHEGGARRLIMYASFALFSMLALPFCGKVNVVWAVSPNYFSSFPGLFYKLLKRSPLVLDVVDLWPEALVYLGFLKSRFIIGLINASVYFFYTVSDKIITLNQFMKREILKRQRNSKVFVVENIVDSSVFRPIDVERFKFLRDKFVVMYSGNLGHIYDFDTVLGAIKNLSYIQDLVLVLRGNGECAAEVHEKIGSFRNAGLFTDVVAVKQVVEFLNMADVFLLPMKKLENCEFSFPIKLVEYMGCGKPVISCAEGDIATLTRESGGGLVVQPGNIAGLSEAILRLYKDRKLCQEIGKKGEKYVIEHLSPEKMTCGLENALLGFSANSD
jgi:glycosyltransferase involved in cell wall biosynthesis